MQIVDGPKDEGHTLLEDSAESFECQLAELEHNSNGQRIGNESIELCVAVRNWTRGLALTFKVFASVAAHLSIVSPTLECLKVITIEQS